MIDILLERILPGVLRLLGSVVLGVLIGSLLEHLGLMRWGAFLARPFVRLGRMPEVWGSTFLVAFASPRAANAMLSDAAAAGTISRRCLVAGAVANTLPAVLVHIRVLAFVLIPLLGPAGIAYVGFQLAAGLACTLAALAASRLRGACGHGGGPLLTGARMERGTWREALRRALHRLRRMVLRVLLITVPLFALVVSLDALGVFRRLTGLLPEALRSVLSPPVLLTVAAHLSSVMTAAGVGSGFLQSGEMTGYTLFLTLVGGYVLSAPVRALRHSIPSALGIFPGRTGLRIVSVSVGIRLAFGLLVLAAGLLIVP